MRYPFVIATLIFVCGCVSPPVETGRFKVEKPERDLAKEIFALAKKCWAKEFGFFSGDGIVVENRVELDGVVITARRSAPDLGAQEPFMRVTVSEGAGGADVQMEEGDYALASKKNFSADVSRWIQGDQTCSK